MAMSSEKHWAVLGETAGYIFIVPVVPVLCDDQKTATITCSKSNETDLERKPKGVWQSRGWRKPEFQLYIYCNEIVPSGE